jgi:hypothetical protein
MERLGCDKPTAVGILECLWHFATKYCPDGGIGKWPDEAIARGIGYQNGAGAASLVSALVESRWLDHNPVARLAIHDWPEHADDAVHLQLARAGKVFLDGTLPRTSRMSQRERASVAPRTESAQKAHEERTALALALALALPKDRPGFDRLLDSLCAWYAYRRQNRFRPWADATLTKQLARMAAMGPERAVAMIDWSIQQGYQGLFEEKGAGLSGSQGRGGAFDPSRKKGDTKRAVDQGAKRYVSE